MTNLTAALNTNKEYKEKVIPALIELVNSDHKNEVKSLHNENRKVWLDENKKYAYIFIYQFDTLTVCYHEKYKPTDKNDFTFHVEQIENGDDFLPNPVLKMYVGKTLTKKESEELGKVWDKKGLSMLQLYKIGLIDKLYKKNGDISESTSSTKVLEGFHSYLYDNQYMPEPMPTDILSNTGKTMAQSHHTKESVNTLIPQLVQLKELTSELGYTTNKKLNFNDHDNAVWIPKLENAIGFSSQDSKFIAVSRNEDKDWQIVHFDSENSDYKTEKSIINAMVEGKIKESDLVLLVKNNTPQYVGNNFMCMEMDVNYSLEAIIEDKQYEERKSVKKAKKKM